MPPDPPAAPPPKRAKPRPRAGVVGPLFSWELVRLARRGQVARARFILAASLLIILGLFTVLYFPKTDPVALFTGTSQSMSLADSASFGRWFATVFIVAQLVILCLLTPAYAAGGISEEKERKTLDYILASDLTSREIIFGKVLGRLTFLLGVLFAGLPILSLTQLYGGVSLDFLLTSYLVTTTTVVMLAAVSAAAAAAVNTYRGALFRAYGLTVLHVFVGCVHPALGPVAVVIYLNNMAGSGGIWVLAGAYSAAQLAVAAGAVWYAVRWVRKLRATPGVPRRPPRKAHAELTPVFVPDADPAAGGLPVARRVKPRPAVKRADPRDRPPTRTGYVPEAVRRRPRIGSGDPFAWKETHTTGQRYTADDDSLHGVVLAVGVVVGLLVGFMALIALISVAANPNSQSTTPAWLVLLPATGCLAVYLLQVGAAAAGMVIRERQKNTLDSLLTIPVDRRLILAPKWRASATKAWVWGVPAALLIPLGFALTSAPLTAVPMAALTPVAAAAVASVGLMLSVRCPTLTRATLWLMLLVGAVTAAPLAIWAFADSDTQAATLAVTGAVVAVTAAAGWYGWWRAVREFEAMGRV